MKPHAIAIRTVEEVSMHGSRAVFAFAMMLTGVACAQAQAPMPEGTPPACFEVIAPQGGMKSPLLLDKCSGSTWQLVPSHRVGGWRSGTLVYRWRPLARPDGVAETPARSSTVAVRPAPARPAVARPAAAPSDGRRCFTFDGRRFCE
jgi:hypothetical protein